MSKSGKVQAKKAGSVTVTIKAQDNAKKRAKVKIKVVAKKKYKKIAQISAATAMKLRPGEVTAIVMDVIPSNASNKNMRYTSDNERVVSVDKRGILTALAEGTAHITVAALDGSGANAVIIVAVANLAAQNPIIPAPTPVLVDDISFEKEYYAIGMGQEYSLNAIVSPQNATNKTIAWSSSDTDVVTISSNGIIKGIEEGDTYVTAAATDGSGKKQKVEIEVLDVSSLTIYDEDSEEEADDIYVNRGLTHSLYCYPYLDGITWTSSNTNVVTVDNGELQGISGGRARITASYGKFQASCDVTVNDIVNVTFDSQGGHEVAPITSFERSYITQPTPIREKYVFKGWYKDHDFNELYDFNQPLVSGDFTLYAKWEEEYLRVSFNQDNGVTMTDIVSDVSGNFQTNGNIDKIEYKLTDATGDLCQGEAIIGSGTWDIEQLQLVPGDMSLEVTASTQEGSETKEVLALTYDRGQIVTTASADEIVGAVFSQDGTTIESSTEEYPFVGNRLLLYFAEEVGENRIDNIISEMNATKIGVLNTVGLYQVQLDRSYDTLDALQNYAADLRDRYDEIETAEPDWVSNTKEDKVYNDPWGGNNDWNVNNPSGNNWWQEVINAPLAWDYEEQFIKTRIGVVDAGFDNSHEDLNVLFSSQARRNENDPGGMDHGNHVAGIIGATANNQKGITGLAWMNDVYGYDWSPTGSQNWETETKIRDLYIDAIEHGCKVVNLSLGRSGNLTNDEKNFSNDLINSWGAEASKDIGKLLEKGFDFVIVQSAGNGSRNGLGVNAKNNGQFCSINSSNCYSSNKVSKNDILSRILIVGACENADSNFRQTNFSNAGANVNIVAPGSGIYSTVLNNQYSNMSGTSMAAPIVTAAASLVWSINPEFTGEEVQDILLTSTNRTSGDNTLSSHTSGTYPIVNAGLAVEEAAKRGGTVSGYFSNAETGQRMSATYVIHKENADGTIEGNADGYTTNSDGSFTISGLSKGTYVLEINAEGFVTNYATIEVPSRGTNDIGTISLTEAVDPNAYRVVLTWGEEPEDLDSHLRAMNASGEDMHVYYNNDWEREANLDVDDTDSYGPETITIGKFNELSSVRYAVHNYTDSDADSSDAEAINLSRSGALVKVYKGSTLLRTYEVPKNHKGTVWTVFSIDQRGTLFDINSMGYESNSSEVLMTTSLDRQSMYYIDALNTTKELSNRMVNVDISEWTKKELNPKK